MSLEKITKKEFLNSLLEYMQGRADEVLKMSKHIQTTPEVAPLYYNMLLNLLDEINHNSELYHRAKLISSEKPYFYRDNGLPSLRAFSAKESKNGGKSYL